MNMQRLRGTESPMDGLEFASPRKRFENVNIRPSSFSSFANNSSSSAHDEPPRKRLHSEIMDWEATPASLSRKSLPLAFASSSSASSSSSSNPTPFMFHSASIQPHHRQPDMDVDEKPSTGSSSSATQEQTAHVATSLSSPQQKQQRDIANGAVQRERRKRDRLKDWQVVKNAEQPVASPEEHESDVDETDGNENNEPTALGFAAPLKAFVRRRKRGEPNQPLHFSLHNHNYHHYPAFPVSTASSSNGPFVFGQTALPPPRPHQSEDSSSSMLLPNVNIQNGWWREEGPYILLGYLQFAFNTSLVLVALYLLLSFLYMLRGDIQDRSREASFELHQSILHCSEAYIQNRCAPETRVPALDARCREWEYCMNKDAKVVGVARVGAETLAEVVNGFVETVSWRTMFFLLAILTILVSFTNTTISSYRRNHTQYHAIHESQLAHIHAMQDSHHRKRPGIFSGISAPAVMKDGQGAVGSGKIQEIKSR